MRWTGIYLDAVAAELGAPDDAAAAVAAGRYDPVEAARSRQLSASASNDPAPDLAVRAGRVALRRSGRPPQDIGLLIHASCWDQGVDFWNVASYVHREVLEHGDALSFELRQMSNGGMCALEVAAGHLIAVPDVRAALLTTGDRFAEPRFLRWSTDTGLVYGDSGTAAVLSRTPGPLRLVASTTFAVPALEGLHRGHGLHAPPPVPEPSLDLAARKQVFLDEMPVEDVIARNTTGMLVAVKRCLQDADADLGDLAVVLLPFFGAHLLRVQCLEPLGIGAERTLLDVGLGTGHLGAGDPFTGLDHLLRNRLLTPGDRVLLVATGAGFNWGCAVVEATEAVTEAGGLR